MRPSSLGLLVVMRYGAAYCQVTNHLRIHGSDADEKEPIEGLGFVQHPSLGVEIGGLAFVHQLHCLVSLLSTDQRLVV